MKISKISKLKLLGLVIFLSMVTPKAEAAIPIAEIIRQGIKRVIVAVDLKVQRMQNETIWLQQAQQEMENILSKVKLEEIASWSTKQKELYSDYYDGFWKVKHTLSSFQRVRDTMATQKLLVKGYENTWKVLLREGQFSPEELRLIENKFVVILGESLRNITSLVAVLKDLTFQLSDGERLEIIHDLDTQVQQNYQDLLRLSLQLEFLSQQRKRYKVDQNQVKNLFK